ncbi:MAG TPA: NAD(P)/FAD-dependent oxidoreductase [Bacteroidaceae bacterium]|nr:NAD(P)/FAD-dependent oxidoreductase [Bacteroidaceae bacterium]
MKYDVIIIGSGLGGLACAHILSKAGKSVLVLEKEVQPGGCLQSYIRNGFVFDTGFHYVGGLAEGQSLYAMFKMLGLENLPWRRMDEAFDRIQIGNQKFSFLQGYDNFMGNLQKSFPDEREALKQYIHLLKQTEQEQISLLKSDRDLPSFSLFETSAWQYLTKMFNNSLLINVLSATSLKMELRKESLPLFNFLLGNASFIESSWRLKGPGSLIVDSLIRDIRKQGGGIICRTTVEELVEKNGRVVCVRCSDGQVYEAEYFISDVHPAVTCSWIKQSKVMRSIYLKRIGALDNTFGMLTVSLVVKPQKIKYFNWNQYIYKRNDVWTFYQENSSVDRLLITARLPEDGGEYLRQIDLITPMSWDNCSRWAQTSVGHRGEEYVEMKQRLAAECIGLAEHFIPDLGKMVEQFYVSTPLTYRDYTGTPEGSAYGIRKDYHNPMMTILSPRTPLHNLLLTGQNLILHGIHGVTMTAVYTCAEILGKEYMYNQLK